MMLLAVPISLREANSFIALHHRHHTPLRFHKFSVGASNGQKLIGVAMVNRPVNISMDDGFTLEVCRLCTDGTKNACTFLLARTVDAARALGYRKIQTYTLEEEVLVSKGKSMFAAGWLFSHCSKGGTWNNSKRARQDKHPITDKFCWAKEIRQ